jgi:hypothetical protein
MFDAITCPAKDNRAADRLVKGAAPWGQTIPSGLAQLTQSQRDVSIDYTVERPGEAIRSVTSLGELSPVADSSMFRLLTSASDLHHAVGSSRTTIKTTAQCDIDGMHVLKLWGFISAAAPAIDGEACDDSDATGTAPLIFRLVFWEISPGREARLFELARQSAEQDRELRHLRRRAALAMSAQ